MALSVVQSYNARRKIPRSKISISDLEVCIAKASFSAAQNSGMLTSFTYLTSCLQLNLSFADLIYLSNLVINITYFMFLVLASE